MAALSIPQIGAMMRDAGFVFSRADPVEATLHYRGDRLVRIKALYAEGGYATLSIGKNGRAALSQGMKRRAIATAKDLAR